MLKKINAGRVESDEGFSIQIIGPEILRYSYDGFEVEFNIDYDKTYRKIYIYVSDVFTWDKYIGSRQISKAMKEEIAKNIAESVQLLDGVFEIV